MRKETFSIISLGCFRNTYDSEVIAARFLKKGFVFKNNFRNCYTLIINTCGFIDKAKEESLEVIQEIIDLKKKKKISKIIVIGCLVERYKEELKAAFPEVDQWQGVVKFNHSFSRCKKLTSSYTDFLKISEGCLNRCSFCAIPLIKGPLRSRPLNEVIREVRYLDKREIKELNIIGQDISSWGKDFRPPKDLVFLLKEIIKNTKNIRWIRLIYTHPQHISDSLIEFIASQERICKYIDLPIQHINDRILKAMNRRLNKKEIINLISRIRKKIPNCSIRTSIIVGFPGETEREFKELLHFLRDIQFDHLGVFVYSREENTPAYYLKGQVHPSTKQRRYRQIMSLQREITSRLNTKFIGKNLDVLVEKKETDVYVGRTQYDAPEVDGVVFIKKKGLNIGDFYRAKIVDAYDYDLVAI